MAEIRQNSDGSATVILSEPVTVDGVETSRLTIPRIKTKHLKTASFLGADETPKPGELFAWANTVVEPMGGMDELPPLDGSKVLGEVMARFQKSLAAQ